MPVFIVALLVALAVSSGAVVASAEAVPGEALYPVKRAVEAVEVSIARSATGRATTNLTHADKRVKELETIKDKAGKGPQVSELAKDLTEHNADAAIALEGITDKGKDVESLVEKLRANLARQQAVLALVEQKVPDHAKQAIQKAQDRSKRGLERAIERHLLGITDSQVAGQGESESAPAVTVTNESAPLIADTPAQRGNSATTGRPEQPGKSAAARQGAGPAK